jgi:hypothetical protein
MNNLNQYSFIAVAGGFVLVAGLILLTNKPKWNDFSPLVVIVSGWSPPGFNPAPAPDPAHGRCQNGAGNDRAGKPVLLEFQSPY